MDDSLPPIPNASDDPIIAGLFIDVTTGNLIDKDGKVVLVGFAEVEKVGTTKVISSRFDYIRRDELLHQGTNV